MKNIFVVAAVVLALVLISSKKHPSNFSPLPVPIQTELEIPVKLKAPSDSQIIGTHTYEITAVIASRSRYYLDASSRYSPVDFALVWGPMAIKQNLDAVSYFQWGRWYYTHFSRSSGVSETDIILNSANTHIIPEYSNGYLKRKLLDFDEGSTVKLKGYLVDVSGDDGFEWNSSLSRNDTGGGACEVFYVTEATLVK